MNKPPTADSGPYWSKMAPPPRKFTEGPLGDQHGSQEDQRGTTEITMQPPNSQLDHQAPSEQEERKDTSSREKPEVVASGGQNEERNLEASSEERKLMPPPPAPAPRAFATPPMPPPSFIPSRATLSPSASECIPSNTRCRREGGG